jgi:hypothetical protein
MAERRPCLVDALESPGVALEGCGPADCSSFQGLSGDRKRAGTRGRSADALASDILFFCYAVSGVAAGRRVWGLQWTAQPFTNSSRKSAALRRSLPQPSKRSRHSRLNSRSKNTEHYSIPHCKDRYAPYRSVLAGGCRRQMRESDDDSASPPSAGLALKAHHPSKSLRSLAAEVRPHRLAHQK